MREKLFYEQKNGYDLIDTEERMELERYCGEYMQFLDSARTEREAVRDAIAYAEIHLMPGVELITSGEYHDYYKRIVTDCKTRWEPYAVRPGQNASTTNYDDTVYASYIVEPEAKLVFTANPNYPVALITQKSEGKAR